MDASNRTVRPQATEFPGHGPEPAHVRDGVNGFMAEDCIEALPQGRIGPGGLGMLGARRLQSICRSGGSLIAG